MSGNTPDGMPAGRQLVASTAHRPRHRRVGWRKRLPTIVVVLGCVFGVTAAVTGAASSLPGLEFLPQGHWVYNTVLQTVFHVDGSTAGVDAHAPLPSAPGSLVVQGDNSGYVVGNDKITVFGKSGLSVERTMRPPADETPLAIEAAGGPYLVYRQAGKIVRLGDRTTVIPTGGPVADPVVTADGTMWLFRPDTGWLCTLPKGADQPSTCSSHAEPGHSGALTLVGDRPEFLDTTAGVLYPLGADKLGPGTPVGVPVSRDTRVAPNDVSGRVALLDPHEHKMHLVDAGPNGRAPTTVVLPKGDYDVPTSTGSSVAVVDRDTDTVLTYDGDGRQQDAKAVPHEGGGGQPRLSRGEDRHVYVEGPEGTHVLVVGTDGKVADVPLVGDPTRPDRKPVPVNPDNRTEQRPTDRPGSTGTGQQDQQDQDTRDRQARQRQQQPEPPKHPLVPRSSGDEQRNQQPQRPPQVSASPPGAPAGVRATAGSGSATVTWGAADNNGSTVTGYRVSWRSSAGKTGSMDLGGASRSATLTGLTNGDSYTISVSARNRTGRGAAAAAKAVTPIRPPAAPKVTALFNQDSRNALVNWTTPDLGGSTLVHYTVDATGAARRTTTGNSELYGDGNLADSGAVTFEVRAVVKTPTGRTLTSAPGTFTTQGAPQQSTPTVHVSQGPRKCDDYTEDHCYYMHVTVTGFPPNSSYDAIPHSTDTNYSNPGHGIRTDANGNDEFDAFQYFGVGNTIWITVDTGNGQVESNHLPWNAI